jgi:hypothetical protein
VQEIGSEEKSNVDNKSPGRRAMRSILCFEEVDEQKAEPQKHGVHRFVISNLGQRRSEEKT